jgi:hypothetical protein
MCWGLLKPSWCTVGNLSGAMMTEKTDSKLGAAKPIPQTRPTGQKRSLERGKSTRKKNPGKRAKQGG